MNDLGCFKGGRTRGVTEAHSLLRCSLCIGSEQPLSLSILNFLEAQCMYIQFGMSVSYGRFVLII